jgi:phosphohistidine phosphatase SixA
MDLSVEIARSILNNCHSPADESAAMSKIRQVTPTRLHALCLMLAFAVCSFAAQGAQSAEDAWALLKKPGHIVLLRHANAPGVHEDPPGIDLKNCKLQRNLDETGRTQARRIGEEFRKRGIRKARLVASQFCRAIDSAKLTGLGRVEQMAALNYINPIDPSSKAAINKTIAFMKSIPRGQLAILVTHVWNVKELSGVRPSSAEMIIVRFDASGKLVMAGRIPPP